MQASWVERLAADKSLGRHLRLIGVGGPRPDQQPSPLRLAVAFVASLTGSLVVCAALAALGPAIFPSIHGYPHFRFSDYAPLATIGVLAACLGWPIVTRISSVPRWLFFRLAIMVSAVLLLPDFYILAKGQPAKAVAVLMIMHLAIGLVTYNLLVRAAPALHRDNSSPDPEPSAAR